MIDVESRPLLLLLATLVSLLTAGVLTHALNTSRSRDGLVGWGWVLAGAVAVGTGLWSTQALGLVGWRLGGPQQFTFHSMALAWCANFAAAAASLLAARALRSQRVRQRVLPWILSLIFAVAIGVTVRVLPVGSELAAWNVGWALAAVALLGASTSFTIWWAYAGGRYWTNADGAPAVTPGVAALGIGLSCAHALALQGTRFRPMTADMPSIEAVDALGLTVAASVGALAVAIAVLGALFDWHNRAHNRSLATSLDEANIQLRRQAFCDPLTNLPNRLLFEDRLSQTLQRVGRTPSAMAVLFIDLDGFKPINDSFGHAAGDVVLREVGARLLELVGQAGTAARIGGDEFLLLVPQPGGHDGAAAVAQQLLQVLAQPYKLPNRGEVKLSCSIGIAMFPEHGSTAKLIANADAAMYAAKRTGGSTYAFFEPRMDLDVREQVEMQNELRLALERGQLKLYYQPKIHGATGQVTGVEALIRWDHPTRGLISPELFIPVAERFGLIGHIGNWVIEEACRQIRQWLDVGLRMRVALNLSMHQLRQDDLVPRIRRALDAHRVDPALLTFEITESVAMEDTQATMRSFGHLARVGASLSIDDFGTGYSSLAYLRKLPARQLKIDRGFVADIEHSTDALAVVDAVIKLAHALGLKVVAEGVETERQRDVLLGLRCDELQGYLFARPMPARALTVWAMKEDDVDTDIQFSHSLFQSDIPAVPSDIPSALQ
ncbi:MAG: EAL domain-containing protein [Ideonella sp.]|nr:EAL domain-containing protein [Ideonella sp.]MCC7457373.1 EAL domain-containing protein [Nitrospira sp.]